MDWLNFAFVGLPTALGTVFLVVIAIKQLGGGKKELHIGYAGPAVKLFVSGFSKSLKVTWDDEPIEDPHLTFLVIRNVGKSDISRSDFSNGRPLEIQSKDLLKISIWKKNPSRAGLRPKINESGHIELGPELIKRGESLVFILLTEGDPGQSPSVVDHLENVKVRTELKDAHHITLRKAKIARNIAAVTLVAYSLVGIAMVWARGWNKGSTSDVFTSGLMFGVSVTLLYCFVVVVAMRFQTGKYRDSVKNSIAQYGYPKMR